jgi:hypothetical protein
MHVVFHRGRLVSSAQSIGREYLDLEKYVNLNYAALQKILKKHDKLVWSAPCWAFYRVRSEWPTQFVSLTPIHAACDCSMYGLWMAAAACSMLWSLLGVPCA